MKYRWLTVKRRLLQRRKFEQPFADLISRAIPAPGTAFKDAEIVSLDIETTGLDATTADMLSVGWVLIREGRVDLSSACTYIVRPSGDVGSSASVHGLTDTMVGLGHDWTAIVSKIVEVLTGRVLLVHHAGLDKVLLDRMCKKQFGSRLLIPVVDTLALEHQRQQRRHHIDEKKSLRLAELRANYNLPRYDAHDCLVDAIATAELLIAMVAHNGGATNTSLGNLFT